MINCKSLEITLNGKTFVKNFNFSFTPSKNYFIAGELGCGKTQLFKCLSGIMRPSKGFIEINSKRTCSQSVDNKIKTSMDLGVLLDRPIALSNLSLKENIKLVASVKDTSFKTYLRILKELNFNVPLTYQMNKLSFEEQVLFCYTLAVAHKPQFLIWDDCPIGKNKRLITSILPHIEKLISNGTGLIFFGEETPEFLGNWNTIQFDQSVTLEAA